MARSGLIVGGYLAGALLTLPCAAGGEELRPYTVVGDAVPDSLTRAPGDATRGRKLLVERTNTCILCHSGPFPEE